VLNKRHSRGLTEVMFLFSGMDTEQPLCL